MFSILGKSIVTVNSLVNLFKAVELKRIEIAHNCEVEKQILSRQIKYSDLRKSLYGPYRLCITEFTLFL